MERGVGPRAERGRQADEAPLAGMYLGRDQMGGRNIDASHLLQHPCQRFPHPAGAVGA